MLVSLLRNSPLSLSLRVLLCFCFALKAEVVVCSSLLAVTGPRLLVQVFPCPPQLKPFDTMQPTQ